MIKPFPPHPLRDDYPPPPFLFLVNTPRKELLTPVEIKMMNCRVLADSAIFFTTYLHTSLRAKVTHQYPSMHKRQQNTLNPKGARFYEKNFLKLLIGSPL